MYILNRISTNRIPYGWLGLAAVALFACAPVLAHGYTYPPGDDPLRLDGTLNWTRQPYYGHFPAALLTMTVYYYLTPVLSYIGAWVLLRRYGAWTPLLAWGALWLLCRTLQFDLHAGTFVGIIGLYFIGFCLLRMIEKCPPRVAPILALCAAPFHAFTGAILAMGVVSYAVAIRKSHLLWTAGFAIVGVFISWKLLVSSVLPPVEAVLGGVNPGQVIADNSGMSFARLVIEYIGLGLIVYWHLAFMLAMHAWQRGWRPKVDGAMVSLGFMAVYLGVMSLPFIAINADRTVKLMVGILTVLATVGIVSGLKYLNRVHPAKAVLNWMAAITIGGAFGIAAPQIWIYWLQSGSYR